MNASPIYLDNNATTRPLPHVIEGVARCLAEGWGNPSSIHSMGEQARALVDRARQQVAALLSARETEVIFTSGATESINCALRGTVEASRQKTPRVLITAVEHEAVLDLGNWLEAHGAEVVRLPVDAQGNLELAALDAALQEKDPTLVSLMLANNETGVVFPVAEVARRAKARGAVVHVDAVQAVGKANLNVDTLGVDLLSLSGHKFHAPKGAGILYMRRGTRCRPLVVGASHEGGRRGGTENVPGIVGLGLAAEHMGQGIPERRAHLAALSARLESGLRELGDVLIQGVGTERLPGTVNAAFRGIEGSAIVLTAAREGVCLSAGSACSAAQYGGSHVLEAMGVPYPYLHGAVRVSCAETTTLDEVNQALDVVARAVKYLHGMDPTRAS